MRPGLGPAAAAALVAGALLFWRSSLRPDIGASPGVVVQAGAAAIWSKRSDGNREKVVLDDGALWIHVDHSRSEAKLVVTLPDGELEDTGTTFTVSVANGRTTRVAVQEGSVVLRINGQPAVAIRGGTVWSPEPRAEGAPAPIPSSNDPETPPAYALPPIVSPTPDATQRRRSLSPQRVAAQRRAATARSVESPESVEPGTDFRAAVAVLDVGANRQAAAAFARFLVEHPRDPRAEDAAYLRVIALDRCGDTDETRRAAQAYLQLYPTGFRRAEIEKLSH